MSFATSYTGGAIYFEIDSDRGDYMVPVIGSSLIGGKWVKLRTDLKWFYFRLGGAGGILYLSTAYKSIGNGYQVYIGQSSATLHRDSQLVHSTQYNSKAWDTEMHEFWVSWENGKIEVGNGKYRSMSSSRFLLYQDESPYTINSLAFAGEDQKQTKFKLFNEDSK